MKKIPSLEELRQETDRAPGPSTAPSTAPPAAPSADGTEAPRVISADELPADVLEHAVRLGTDPSADSPTDLPGAGAASNRPKRGAVRRSSGSRLNVRRRYSRERAVQALYAWDIGDTSATEVLRYFLDRQDMSRADIEWFREAFTAVAHDPAPIDALIAPSIDRKFDELDPVERAILRLGVWELRARADTPVKVVINEAVEVAKRFGAEQGHRFVNGVLDTVARQVRAAEIG